jgi:hypothetical protein
MSFIKGKSATQGDRPRRQPTFVELRKLCREATSPREILAAGVEFIDENGGGPGVRLRKRHQKKS